MSEVNNKKYDLFISYYSGTGSDFAQYLKAKLEDFRINAFLDSKDIPKSVKKNSDEWRKIIDESLLNSNKLILLMTLGFNSRPEVLRELKIAIDNKIERIQFKHVNLPKKDLIVKIEGKTLDLSKFQYLEFDDEPDLLRKLGVELKGSESSKSKKSIFSRRAQDIINSEGENARIKDNPIIEVVIGSSDEAVEWLPTTTDNKKIVGMAPIWCNVTTRRYFFECETREDEFLRVHPNGFFHFIVPIIYDTQKNLSWIDVIIHQILDIFIYCTRVMKFRQITSEQSLYVKLRNISNLELTFDGLFYRRRYNFCPEFSEVDFTYNFNPNEGWLKIREMFEKIFKDFCIELGISDMSDSNIRKRLFDILRKNQNIHREYHYDNIIMPRINMDEFRFTEEEKK